MRRRLKPLRKSREEVEADERIVARLDGIAYGKDEYQKQRANKNFIPQYATAMGQHLYPKYVLEFLNGFLDGYGWKPLTANTRMISRSSNVFDLSDPEGLQY